VPGETVGWLTVVALGVVVGLGELLAAGGAADEQPPASTARPVSAIAAPARTAMDLTPAPPEWQPGRARFV
jgi:hypothetical protein